MIERVAIAISAEESRYTLDGAPLQTNDGKEMIAATDGHHMAVLDVPPAHRTDHPCSSPLQNFRLYISKRSCRRSYADAYAGGPGERVRNPRALRAVVLSRVGSRVDDSAGRRGPMWRVAAPLGEIIVRGEAD